MLCLSIPDWSMWGFGEWGASLLNGCIACGITWGEPHLKLDTDTFIEEVKGVGVFVNPVKESLQAQWEVESGEV